MSNLIVKEKYYRFSKQRQRYIVVVGIITMRRIAAEASFQVKHRADTILMDHSAANARLATFMAALMVHAFVAQIVQYF